MGNKVGPILMKSIFRRACLCDSARADPRGYLGGGGGFVSK